jgi:hypothetical protein
VNVDKYTMLKGAPPNEEMKKKKEKMMAMWEEGKISLSKDDKADGFSWIIKKKKEGKI